MTFNYIAITPDHLAMIRSEKIRTGLGPRFVLRHARDVPEGLNFDAVCRWLYQGQNTAPREHLDFFLAAYRAYPDNRKVALTPEIRGRIRAEIIRTGVRVYKFAQIVPNLPRGLSLSGLNNIVSEASGLRFTSSAQLDFILKTYASFPDETASFTPEQAAWLSAQMKRTGIASAAIVLEHPDKPLDLRCIEAEALFAGKLSKFPPSHWAFIEARYKGFPDRVVAHLSEPELGELRVMLADIPIAIADLDFQFQETRRGRTPLPPLADILTGRTDSLSPEAWDEVKAFLEHLSGHKPIKSGKRSTGLMTLSEEMIAELGFELGRTGVEMKTILLMWPPDLPPVRAIKITKWKTGRSRKAKIWEWRTLMGILKALPDRDHEAKAQTRSFKNRPDHAPIPDEVIEAIRFHRERTGVGFSKLLKAVDAPKGLGPHIISSWLSGASRRAKPEYVRWVVEAYEGLVKL